MPKRMYLHRVRCRYLDYKLPNGRVIFLPLIHVGLVSESETFTTIGLLDSGATLSFIPHELAEILDIIPEKAVKVPVETAGGSADFFAVVLKKLSLLVGGKVLSIFNNMHLLMPPTERDLPYVILGRDYVFRRFHVTFKENIRKYELLHHKWAGEDRFQS